MIKLKKIRAGLYATEDGLYEIEKDAWGYDYITVAQREHDGVADDGWSLSKGDTVLDWFDTKREATEALKRILARENV